VIQVFQDPLTNVVDAAFFPNCLTVASVYADKIFRVWSVAAGSVLYFEGARQGGHEPRSLAERTLRGGQGQRGDHCVSRPGLRPCDRKTRGKGPDLWAKSFIDSLVGANSSSATSQRTHGHRIQGRTTRQLRTHQGRIQTIHLLTAMRTDINLIPQSLSTAIIRVSSVAKKIPDSQVSSG